jgi:predicted nuclease of predicted toxin-antitoxin system
MKLLLDECMPRRLRRDLTGHDVSTIEQAGLKGLQNGRLLRAASGVFDVLLTVDQNIPSQQNIRTLPVAILIFVVKGNTYENLKALTPRALQALTTIKPGEVVRVEE